MPRIYTVAVENVAVSAAQDFFQVKGAAGKTLRVLRVNIGSTDTTLPTAQMCRWRCRFLPTTVTDGSGGSTPTPQKNDPGDAAASFTALANNTTPATTNATAVVLAVKGVHIHAEAEFNFQTTRGWPVIGPSESVVVELLSTVTGTVHMSGTIELEESGG